MIHNCYLFAFLLFFFINLPSLYAQLEDSDFKKVPIEVGGEVFNTFYAITQDQEGYLWLGTNHGLLRYDGYEAKVYRHDPKDSTTIGGEAEMWIGSNPIYLLHIDKYGDLWAGTNNDLSRYSAECDCFSHYRFSHGEGIYAMSEDNNKNLWIGAGTDGLLKYDQKNDGFIPFLNDSKDSISLINDFVNELLVDQYNNIWIGTRNSGDNPGGLIRFNPATGATKRFLHNPNPNSLLDNRVSSLLEDKNGQIWVGTAQNGLHQYNEEKEDFTRILPDATQPNYLQAPFPKEKKEERFWAVHILHQNQNGDYWAGTRGVGLNHFDPVSSKLTFYNPTKEKRAPEALFEDRQGQLWLGYSDGRGLFKMDTYARKFKENPKVPRSVDIFESPSEPGIFWLGTGKDKGLYRFDTKTGEITNHFLHDEQDDKSIRGNDALSIYEDQDQMLWITIREKNSKGGLDRLNLQTGIFKHYDIMRYDTSSSSHATYGLATDQEGYLWMDARKVILRFDKNKETFKRYYFPETSEHEGAQIWLVEGYAKTFFGVCDYTNKILYRYDIEKDSFVQILDGYKVNTLLEDEDGSFWMATWAQGLLHWTPSNDSLEVYSWKEGLISDGIMAILPGESGVYWLATQKGLTKFNSKTKKFTSHGLPRHPYILGSAKGVDGQMLFGHEKGVTAFYPNQVNGNPFPPEVVLSGLSISGKSYDLKNVNSEKINLSYQQNDFNFKYTGIHNGDPSKNQYQYQLSPFDNNWIDAGFQRTARYTNLNPGTYTFRVKAANSDGVWSEEVVSIPFYITSPWWTKWWAYALYIITFGTITYGFYHFQLSKKLAIEEGRRQKEINKLKTNLYTNITHEFRTPLTVILGMADALKSNIENKHIDGAEKSLEMIQRNGANLLYLVNEMLDLAKLESGNLTLDLAQANVIPFVKYLSESFHSLAEEKQINLVVYAEMEELVMDFDAKKLSTIISNLLSNAVKFTPIQGKIIIHLNQISQQTTPYFFIKIKDNGIGISKPELANIFNRFHQTDNSSTRLGEGTGIGLALTKELVELMGGIIEVKSTLGKGSEFEIQIPVSRNAPITTTQLTPKSNSFALTAMPSVTSPNLDPLLELPLALIIEDNADVAHYLKDCLKNKYQTFHAINGKIGIEIAFEKIPDIIICDVMMPEMDGFEVCAILKKEERTDHIPIIILTAKATKKDRLTGLSFGADAYLIKPFAKAELMIRLNKLMEIRKTLQKKYSNGLVRNNSRNENAENKMNSFIEKAQKLILEHLEEADFSANEFAHYLHLSRSQVYRKIKALTGMSTSIYIRFVRLEKAKELLACKELTISEIAYQVGFKSPVYFSQKYKETFGESPSDSRIK